ncbi:MAG: hypothetical protein ACRD2W_22995, partial [Acidimicrobiales bacterium]
AQAPPAAAPERPPVEAPALPLNGCPPPPRPPGSGAPGPVYVPPRLVPESELPAPLPPGEWQPQLAALEGKGMWLWKYFQSEGGNADAIVERAAAAGLRQLWVRVGDSRDQFYAKEVLDQIVPKAHRKGITVIGWGFPYLFDPVGDAKWTAAALAWRSPSGDMLDGFSPDIELQSEGVAISELRVKVYLGLVRQAARNRLLVGTVYRPSDRLWPSAYPYAAIASYVDAFAPMVYWNCLEPGALALESVERLKTLKPVHAIGQAWDPSPEGGRGAAPSAHETDRFLDVSKRNGAVGASFWVWHLAGEEQWNALSAFPWPAGR